jgi:hypothetical protein
MKSPKAYDRFKELIESIIKDEFGKGKCFNYNHNTCF